MFLSALVERLFAHGLVTPSVASPSYACNKLTHFVPTSRSTSQGSSHQQRVLVINFPCGLLEPHYGGAWSSSMVDEDAVFLWTSRCVASRVRNARCIRAIHPLSAPRVLVSAHFSSLRASADCACAALYAVVMRCWAAASCSWLHVVHPGHAVDHVCAWFGLLRSRSRWVMSRRSACYMACPARGRVGWRRAVDDTGHEGGSSAPGEGGRGRGVAVGGRGAGSLRPRGRSRRARSTFCVSHDVCTNETVSMSYETENVHSLPTAAPAHP